MSADRIRWIEMPIILITGCSSGFGLLSAARLSTAGYIVYATMRDLKKSGELIKEVKRRGGEVQLMRLDVTDDESINAVIKTIEEQEGRLHVIINNAGYGIGGFFEDLTEKEIRDQFETNYFGVLKVTRAALPLMRKTAARVDNTGKVKIINVSSVQGRSAFPGMSAYAASKHALEGFSESLFHELRPFGIQVVSIEPGSFDTKIFTENKKLAAGMGKGENPYISMASLITDRLNDMLSSGKNLGDPEKVAILLQKIIESPKSRFRYVIGTMGKIRLLILRWLPYRVYARLLSRIVFANKRPD